MRLTILQRIALWIGIGLVLLVGLFPPWVYLNFSSGPGVFEYFDGYRFLFLPCDATTRIDGRMWFVNVGTIVLVTGGVLLALSTRRPKEPRHD